LSGPISTAQPSGRFLLGFSFDTHLVTLKAALDCLEEERLHRGRVSVRGRALVSFEKAMRRSLAALTSAQEALARLKVPPNAIPRPPSNAASVQRVRAEYARRGEEALARHGVEAVD
jgi:hypothetical protein